VTRHKIPAQIICTDTLGKLPTSVIHDAPGPLLKRFEAHENTCCFASRRSV